MESVTVYVPAPVSDELATAVVSALADRRLADSLTRSGLGTAALYQPILPERLDDATRNEFLAARERICATLGMRVLPAPKRPAPSDEPLEHAPEVDADADAPRKRVARLLPASALASARLRVSLCNASPHFRRAANGATSVLCNGCGAELPVRTDKQLRAAVFAPVWSQYRWKTFLCTACSQRALSLSGDDASAHCQSCFAREADQWIPLRYARADDAHRPRELPLCATCAEQSRPQLATVVYETPGVQ